MEMRVPRQIVLEVTNRCQLRCKGCPSAGAEVREFGLGDMDFEFFRSVIDRVNFPTTITLWLNGEPLLHPRYAEMAKYVSDAGLRWYITTNGMIWDDATFGLITGKSSCYQILFSVDGLVEGPSTSFESVRPGVDRDTVRETIRRFMALRDSKGHELDIGVKLCERGQDAEEIENWIAYWLEAGVDFCVVGKMLQGESRGTRLYPCRYFDDMAMEIRWDGTAIPCSYHPAVANGHALDMGVLDRTTPLLEFYNNAAYTALREAHARGEFPKPCDTCAFAYCGDGFDGETRFRNKGLDARIGLLSTHNDYYNTFYSKTRKREGVSFGGVGGRTK